MRPPPKKKTKQQPPPPHKFHLTFTGGAQREEKRVGGKGDQAGGKPVHKHIKAIVSTTQHDAGHTLLSFSLFSPPTTLLTFSSASKKPFHVLALTSTLASLPATPPPRSGSSFSGPNAAAHTTPLLPLCARNQLGMAFVDDSPLRCVATATDKITDRSLPPPPPPPLPPSPNGIIRHTHACHPTLLTRPHLPPPPPALRSIEN